MRAPKRELDPRHAGARRGVGNAVPELERAFAVRERLGERVHLLGRARRVDRGGQGAVVVVGLEPMAGDLTDPLGFTAVEQARRLDEQLREPRVQPGALPGSRSS